VDDRADAARLEGFEPDGDGFFERLRDVVSRQDWNGANAIVRDEWYALAAADSEVTISILEQVPPSALRTKPLIAMELGIAYNKLRYHRLRAVRYFVMAVRAARSSGRTELDPIDRLLIRAAESGAFRLLGRTVASVNAARAASRIAEDLTVDERAAVRDLPRVYAVIGVSLLYGGFPEEALDAGARGLAEAPTTVPSNGFGALALLTGIHTANGDLPDALEHLEYARRGPWTDAQRNGYSGSLYRVAEAVVALEAFDVERARDGLRSLRALTTGRHANEHWATIASTAAMIDLVDGNAAKGLADLDAFAALRGGEGRASRARLAGIRSLLQLALGNPHAAAAVLDRDVEDRATSSIARARVALTLGQTGTALQHLRATAQHQLTTRQTAEAVALEVAILLRVSATARRESVLRRLGALLESSGLRLPLVLMPAEDVRRVAAGLETVGFEHVTAAIPRSSLFLEIDPGDLLSERELAVLARLVQDRTVAEIATSLAVSSNTVKSQLRSVYRKLGVTDRQGAIAMALELHLLVDRD